MQTNQLLTKRHVELQDNSIEVCFYSFVCYMPTTQTMGSLLVPYESPPNLSLINYIIYDVWSFRN